jgi:hypothetical protein
VIQRAPVASKEIKVVGQGIKSCYRVVRLRFVVFIGLGELVC